MGVVLEVAELRAKALSCIQNRRRDAGATRWEMAWVAGVDGCRNGWFLVLRELGVGTTRHRRIQCLGEVCGQPEKPTVVAVDIPIGLLAHGKRGGRECDKKAREFLGKPRSNSVFSPPVRPALNYFDFPSALRANRASSLEGIGISQQCFHLFAKIREADKLVMPDLQGRIFEVHPELCFYELNIRTPMKYGKKHRGGLGLQERRDLLCKEGFSSAINEARAYRRSEVAEDDFLDACVACWTAERILQGAAACIPENPSKDERGLRMEMWC
jgi:predicted RNase H-like nuclease